MKSICFILSAHILLGFATLAVAQKKEPSKSESPVRNIRITVDMISLPRAEAFELVRLDSAPLWEKLRAMVKAGGATSEYIATATTIAGERCIVECINEMRYPTEFQAPVLADFGVKTPEPTLNQLVSSQLCPTAFETRNTGLTMEVLPQLSGEGIRVELIPSRTNFERFISYPQGAEKSLLKADQPQFETLKIQTKVQVGSGKPFFLGAGDMHAPKEGRSAERVVLFFLTATFAD